MNFLLAVRQKEGLIINEKHSSDNWVVRRKDGEYVQYSVKAIKKAADADFRPDHQLHNNNIANTTGDVKGLAVTMHVLDDKNVTPAIREKVVDSSVGNQPLPLSANASARTATSTTENIITNVDYRNKLQNILGEDNLKRLDVLRDGKKIKPPDIKKQPILSMLKKNGGVDPKSLLAQELKALGITHKTNPDLFKKLGFFNKIDAISETLLGDDGRADYNDVLDATQALHTLSYTEIS